MKYCKDAERRRQNEGGGKKVTGAGGRRQALRGRGVQEGG